MVVRAAVWKSTPQPVPAGLPLLILCSLSTVVTSGAYDYVTAGADPRFALYGVNAHLAALLVTIAVAASFVRSNARATFLSALTLIASLMWLLWLGAALAHWVSPYDRAKPISAAGDAVFALSLIWWGGAVLALLRSIEPEGRFKLWRTVGLWVSLVLVTSALPYEPLFHGHAFDHRLTNLWEYVAAYRNGSFARDAAPKPPAVDRARLELAQPALMDAQISRLVPRVSGKINVYAIGIAGSSDQNVFVKELNGGLHAIASAIPLGGGIVRMVNNIDTVKSFPVASRQNFAASVRAVARVMNRDKDVLLLFMTSHGSEDGLALYFRGAFYGNLAPADVAAALDDAGIKNRVVIVSACYSGVFLKPLANEHTIILTAADDKHPSFGCSNEREWTYFGDAFFHRSLLPGKDLEQAFQHAKADIARWEARDGVQPSNPQGYFGKALMSELAPLFVKTASAGASLSVAGR